MTRIPFHPLLFAMLPVVSMFAANPGQRAAHELTDSLTIVVGLAAIVVLVATAIYRDARKAALAVSALLLVWWVQIGDGSIGGLARSVYVVALTYLAILVWAVWLYCQRTPVRGLTGLANWVAVGAILPPSVVLGVTNTRAGVATGDTIVAGEVRAKPDIYYLVFDRYGDEQSLTAYGLENDIDEYLTSKGFYVASASRSNYMKTTLSLASSLNAEYLDNVLRGKTGTTNWAPVYQHLRGHKVGAFLRSQGYSYTHLGSWFYPTRENPQATRNVNYYTTVPRAVLRMFDSEAFSPVQRAFGPWLDERTQNYLRVRREVDDLLKGVPTSGPKFVFFHVLVPHPPYVFDRDGTFVTKAQERQRSFAQNYTNQVMAANEMIRRLVSGILRDSASPPVIIVQGDEGPYPPGTGRDSFDWRTANASQLLVKTGILNAYHLPNAGADALYATISPVNSFRVVFNLYFGTDLPLLPDRTIRHVSDLQPFVFDDITSQVTTVAHSTVKSRLPAMGPETAR